MEKLNKDITMGELQISDKQDESTIRFYNTNDEPILKIDNTGKLTFSDMAKAMNIEDVAKEFIDIVEKHIFK